MASPSFPLSTPFLGRFNLGCAPQSVYGTKLPFHVRGKKQNLFGYGSLAAIPVAMIITVDRNDYTVQTLMAEMRQERAAGVETFFYTIVEASETLSDVPVAAFLLWRGHVPCISHIVSVFIMHFKGSCKTLRH